jgi:tRNA pseudouridine synthase 10
VGTRVDGSIERYEEALWGSIGATGESVRKELNREIGKRYGDDAGKEADLNAPELSILVDTRFDYAEATPNPLYLRGRYRKLARDLPQTRWPCQRCQGRRRGCARCGRTGRLYPDSVEELVGAPLLATTGGQDHKFHAMGREDIDARMLGRGRPFVIEITRPRRRSVGLVEAEARINQAARGRVEVTGLARSSAAEIERLGAARAEKSYQVRVRSRDGLTGLDRALATLTGAEISQRTPVRVSHRRADLVRRRVVVSASVGSRSDDPREAVINIRAAAGTYIKELVHGDSGRTSPSLAGLLLRPVEVVELDVLEVHDEE